MCGAAAAAAGAGGADRGAAGTVWPECVSRLANSVDVARCSHRECMTLRRRRRGR